MKEMESSLQEHREIISHQHAELKLFNDKLTDESKKVKSLERESDRLRHEVALLESKVLFLNYVFFSSGAKTVSKQRVLKKLYTILLLNLCSCTQSAMRSP
jgi:chromosome segregation ATPase